MLLKRILCLRIGDSRARPQAAISPFRPSLFFSSAPRSRPPNRLPPPLAGSPCCSRHIKKDQAASPATVLPRPTASSNEAQFGRTDSGRGGGRGREREILKVYRPWKKGTRKHEQPSARLTWRLFRRGKGAGGEVQKRGR